MGFQSLPKELELEKLRQECFEKPWYGTVERYLRNRYSTIESRMTRTFNYVTPDTSNRKTHSYKFASLLRDIGSVFDSTIKEILSKLQEKGYDDNICGLLKFLESRDSKLQNRTLAFSWNMKKSFPSRNEKTAS